MNRRTFFTAAAVSALPVGAFSAPVAATLLPAPALDPASTRASETVILAGGCFWGIQAVFAHVKGVTRSVSGYCGGTKETADYEVVGTGRTGHAESVYIAYDPRVVSFGKLLQIFFTVGTDPTELNRQTPDVGPQYRGEIFTTTDDQFKTANAYFAQLTAAKVYRKPIASRVTPAKPFYAAEDYHQDFLFLNPTQGYIAMWDQPKIRDLKRLFPANWRETPIRVFPNKEA